MAITYIFEFKKNLDIFVYVIVEGKLYAFNEENANNKINALKMVLNMINEELTEEEWEWYKEGTLLEPDILDRIEGLEVQYDSFFERVE